MNLKLKNKIVIVVGASKNIGESIVKDFAEQNSKVIIIARDKSRLIRLHKMIGGYKKGHSYFATDLNNNLNIINVFEQIEKKYNKIDILVNNIGGSLSSNDSLLNIDQVKKVWDFNVSIAIQFNNFVIPMMLKNKGGKIIHISSITSLTGDTLKGSVHYAASKAYLNSYVKSLGRIYAKNKININAILPGAIYSKGKYWDRLKKNQPNKLKKFLSEKQLIGRLGEPNDISSFVVFLASDKSSFACGSIISVDGAWI